MTVSWRCSNVGFWDIGDDHSVTFPEWTDLNFQLSVFEIPPDHYQFRYGLVMEIVTGQTPNLWWLRSTRYPVVHTYIFRHMSFGHAGGLIPKTNSIFTILSREALKMRSILHCVKKILHDLICIYELTSPPQQVMNVICLCCIKLPSFPSSNNLSRHQTIATSY